MKSLLSAEKVDYNEEGSISNLNINPSCNSTITPSCLLKLYNATQYKLQAADKGNKIAVSSYLSGSMHYFSNIEWGNTSIVDQFANLDDLQGFYETFVPAAVGSTFDVVYINGNFIIIYKCV